MSNFTSRCRQDNVMGKIPVSQIVSLIVVVPWSLHTERHLSAYVMVYFWTYYFCMHQVCYTYIRYERRATSKFVWNIHTHRSRYTPQQRISDIQNADTLLVSVSVCNVTAYSHCNFECSCQVLVCFPFLFFFEFNPYIRSRYVICLPTYHIITF